MIHFGQALSFALGVGPAVEVAGTEVFAGVTGGQDVPDDDEDGVCDGEDRLAVAER